MPHKPTVAAKRSPKKRSGRPLSKESALQLSFMDAIIEDDHLKAVVENAVAKKRASIESDMALHNALVAHMQRLRTINSAVASVAA
jgi:hypothetical protein